MSAWMVIITDHYDILSGVFIHSDLYMHFFAAHTSIGSVPLLCNLIGDNDKLFLSGILILVIYEEILYWQTNFILKL